MNNFERIKNMTGNWEWILIITLGVNGLHAIMYSLGIPIIIGIENQLKMLWMLPIFTVLIIISIRLIIALYEKSFSKKEAFRNEI